MGSFYSRMALRGKWYLRKDSGMKYRSPNISEAKCNISAIRCSRVKNYVYKIIENVNNIKSDKN